VQATARGSGVSTRDGLLEGFVVEAAGNRVGQVSGLRPGVPGFLEVRAGMLGRRRMMISAADIAEILPAQKRIRLQPTWMTIEA
jgi:hypothetical protein